MKKQTISNKFTPLSIDDVNVYTKAEYGEYCAEKFAVEEIPFSFNVWQILKFEASEMTAEEFTSGLI
jgi:hypothetical protein